MGQSCKDDKELRSDDRVAAGPENGRHAAADA